MPRQTILAKIYSRTLGLAGPGPIWTCKKLTWTYRRDGAGSFRAEFPATDAMLQLVALKNTYLWFSVGGRDVFLGLVERINTRMDRRGRQTAIITGRDQLGALAENTVGNLDLSYVYDAHVQIVGAGNVPNQTFTVTGEAETAHAYAKTFAGESVLAALIRLAADSGEHFRAPTDGTLTVVWLGSATPDAPIRLVSSGGPLLHENEQVAIIEEIESDADGFEMTNVVYAFGSGNGGARLTLQHATLTLPAGYSYGSDSSGYYIANDAQQILPSVRRAAWKSFNHIGVTSDSYEMTPAGDALAGATTIVLEEAVPFAIADGTLLDLNGLGVDFVELSAGLSAGGNVLNVVALGFDVLTTDTLVYTDPVALEGAANQLAQVAATWLQRVSDPDKMVAYSMTVRGLPDSVQVGMKIPVLSQAPGFAIDDDLIILEIGRTADSKGRTPAVLKVVPVDWFAPAEAANIAMQLEELHNYQAQSQPVAYSSLVGAPDVPATFIDLSDTPSSYSGAGELFVKVNAGETALEFALGSGGAVDSVNGQTGAVVLDTGDVAESGNLYYTAERARDDIGVALTAGTGITVTPNDVADTITVATTITQYTDELAQDAVGAMVSGNTETGIAVTYDDAGNKLNFDAQTAGDARYAPIAKGVTNGDSHDHNGGDGAQINHTTLSNIGANTHAQIDTALATAVTNDATAAAHIAATAAHGATGAVVGTTNSQTLTNKTLTTPTVGDFTNAGHDHSNAAGGGNIPTAGLAANAVTYAKMQDIATDSLIGRDTTGTGDPETITLGASLSMTGAQVLQRAALTGDVTAAANSNATAIGSNKVLTAMIADAQLTLAKMADLAQATIIGRASAAGTGVPTALTAAQVVAIIQATTDTLYGPIATTSGIVTSSLLGNVLRASIAPGGITTAQTWTIDITLSLAGNRVGAVVDVFIEANASSSATERIYYRAAVAFSRNVLTNTAVIEAVNEAINVTNAVTLTGPTAIADGIRYTVAPTAATLNRSGAHIVVNAGPSAPVVTSAVA